MSYLGALSVPGPIGIQGMHGGSMMAASYGASATTRSRSAHAQSDASGSFDESYCLLMELVSQEPTIQSCIKIIQSTCLAQGLDVQISGSPASRAFNDHIDNHYVRFCEQAIRAMFTYGFVPWRMRKLATYDAVPEVVPMGLFTWSTESISERESRRGRGGDARRGGDGGDARRGGDGDAKLEDARRGGGGDAKRSRPSGGAGEDGRGDEKRQRNPGFDSAIYRRQQAYLRRQGVPECDEETKALVYRIHFTEGCGIHEDEVEIFEYIQPNRDVTAHSVMYRTVSSPLAHILNDYRNLRRAIIQQEYADTWNSQARMVCSYASAKSQWTISEGNPITNDWVAPQNRLGLTTDTNLPAEIEQNAYARDAVLETIVASKRDRHRPTIYTLPKNSKLEPVQRLEISQDIKTMQIKLAKDITSIMGIPYELVGGGYSDKEGKKKSMENTRIFTTNMMNLCKHLEFLLRDVYVATYGGRPEDVRFTLRPTPRIEIGSVEEIIMLLEAGVVSADNAMQISNMLLGVDLQQGAGAKANAGTFSKAFMTPANKKDASMAQASMDTARAAVESARARARAGPA